MAKYSLEIKKSVLKDLVGIPSADVSKIRAKIEALQDDPRPAGCIKLSGREEYRVRQGNYRILYEIRDQILIVIVIKVAHRKEVYK